MSLQSISVTTSSIAPYLIGSTIHFEASIQPAISGLNYIWLDQSGNLIDMGIDKTSVDVLIADGQFNRVVIVNVIESDHAISGSLKYTVQYAAPNVTPPNDYIPLQRPRSNLELYRWLSYMPKWSFAATNHISNYSKLTGFSYNTLMDIAAKPILFAATNLLGAKETIDYPNKTYLFNTARQVKQIITDVGVFENIGPDAYASFDSYPITNCYLQEASITNFEYDYNSDTDFERFSVPKECNLYLTLTDNEQAEVTIVGLNAKGQLVRDTKTLLPRISAKTINKYKIVIGIYSKVAFNISTLSKSDSYRTDYIDFKRITNRNGDYFEPFFTVDYNDPKIISARLLNNADVYKFKLDKEIDKFVVTENLDLLFISNSTLYASKLYFDLSVNAGVTSTFNNNQICSIEYDDVIDGEEIVFIIDVASIAGISTHFKIKLQNGDDIYWYDGSGNVSTESTIAVDGLASKIIIRKQKLNSNPYVMSVFVENIKEIFQSGVIDNIIASYKLADDVYDLSIYNGNIYAHSSTTASQRSLQNNDYVYHSKVVDINQEILNTTTSLSKIFKIIPIRGCFTTTEYGIILTEKIKIEEILYE